MRQQLKKDLVIKQNFIAQDSFLEMIDYEVRKFINSPSSHYLIEKAKKENYFGSLHSKKDTAGLLGYLRMNFAMQIKILNNYSNHFEIDKNYSKFLRSDWFRNAVLSNNCISYNLNFKGFDTFNFNL